MAKAIYEKRLFNDHRTGETIKYDWYGIKGIGSDGKEIELNLSKLMDSANKIAFKVVAACDDPINESNTNVETRKASESEIKEHQAQIKKTPSTAGNNAFNLDQEDSLDPSFYDEDDEK